MIKRLKIGDVILALGVFAIIYNPPIFSFNTAHLVAAISFVYLAFNKITSIDRKKIFLLAGYIIIWIYLMLNLFLFRQKSFVDIIGPIYVIIDIFPFAYAVSTYMRKKCLRMDYFIRLLLIVGIIQSGIAIAAFIDRSFQQLLVRKIMVQSGAETYNYWSTVRMFGFSNGLFFEEPVVQTVLSLVAVLYANEHGKKYWIVSLILFFSAIINARTSIVVFAVGIVLMILVSKLKLIKKVQIIAGLVMLIGLILLFILPLIKQSSLVTYEWIMDGIEDIRKMSHGDTSSGYFSYLADSRKYKLPDDLVGFLFGHGIFVMGGKNSFGISSDIGYVNSVWYGGVVYLVAQYSLVISGMLKLFKNRNVIISYLGMLFFFLLFILNFKGLIFEYNCFLAFTLLFYFISDDNNS